MPETPKPDVTDDALERLRHGVRLLALHELGDVDAADEVAQETLSRVVQALSNGQVRDHSRLGAFAHGIARHVIVDLIRYRRRQLSLEVAPVSAQVSDRIDPLTALVSAERLEAVHVALKVLGDGDREILRLAFFDGITSEEIALRLGEPAARVRKRKERALDRLRRAFNTAARHTRTPSATLTSAERRLVGVSTLRAE